MPKVTLAVVAAMLLLRAPTVLAQHYYLDLLSTLSRQLIIQKDGISAGGTLTPVKFCPANSDYKCFNGGGLKFAVPKNPSSRDSWTYDGAAYKVTRRERLQLLGEKVEIIFIEHASEGETFRFVFSNERGLVGIGLTGKAQRFFLLENRCGFASSSTCR